MAEQFQLQQSSDNPGDLGHLAEVDAGSLILILIVNVYSQPSHTKYIHVYLLGAGLLERG